MKKNKHEKPISIEEQLPFDEALRRIMNSPKEEVEKEVQKELNKNKRGNSRLK